MHNHCCWLERSFQKEHLHTKTSKKTLLSAMLRSRWVLGGGKMIKDGIWKILLGNDRLQKSRVRRFKKQLEGLNQFGCLKPVVPVLGFALAGRSLQPGFCKCKTNHFS